MSGSTYAVTLRHFLNETLYPHRCLANLYTFSHQEKGAVHLEISDAGVVLEALNALAEIKLNAFIDQTEQSLGNLKIEQPRDGSTVLRVSLVAPAEKDSEGETYIFPPEVTMKLASK